MTEWVRLPKVTKTATLEGWRNRPCEEGGGEPGAFWLFMHFTVSALPS